MLFRGLTLNNLRLTLPTPLRYALFALFIAGILAYGAAVAGYMLANFDLINLIRDVNTDDAFYYFQIAYHLAEGKFSTFDGGITRTNGYHPLWMFLITPFYWILDKEAALLAIKAFEIMLIAGGVACIAAAARLARLPWLLLFATLPLLYQYQALFIGMEAAAALFMLGLFFLTILLYARNPARWTWPLAAVAFALPWVRLEYIAISLTATVALCVIEWSRRERERPGGASWRTAIISTPPPRRTLVPIISAVAGLLIYFAYNGVVFGGIMPVSGATKQVWSQIAFEREGGYSLTQNLRDILQIHVFDYELLVALEICAYLLLVWWVARRSGDRQDWVLLIFLVVVFALAAEHLAKFAQTVLTMSPRYAGHSWYFVPAYLMIALIVPVRCYVAIHFVHRFIRPRWPQAANALSVGIVVTGGIFLFVQADFTALFKHIDGARKTESTNAFGPPTYAGMLVMNRALPDESIIGSWDSGLIGYFSDFPVVNLDGLVNDYDFLREHTEIKGYGGGIHHGNDYAQTLHNEFGITHYANTWPVPVNGTVIFVGPIRDLYDGGRHRSFQIWPADPMETAVDPVAWFWERMEPHFDYQSEGIGLVVDGRLAQAFARDCAGELIMWSWAERGEEAAARGWTNTQTGLCGSALVLPRNAASPARVASMPAINYLAQQIGDSPPAIRSDYDVYFNGDRLIYVKEQCSSEDCCPAFFVHLDPVDLDDLPAHRQQYGFDNLDFPFAGHGEQFGETCFAVRELPQYAIDSIRTGQYTLGEGRLWEGEFSPAQ